MHFVTFLRLSTSRFLPNLWLIKWAVRYNSESVKFWHSTGRKWEPLLVKFTCDKNWRQVYGFATQLTQLSLRMVEVIWSGCLEKTWDFEADLLRRRVESSAKIWGKWSWSRQIDPGDPTKSMDLMLLKTWRRIDELKVTIKKTSEVKKGTGSHF